MSEAIRRVLTLLNIRTALKPVRTLRSVLVHMKDPLLPGEQYIAYLALCARHYMWDSLVGLYMIGSKYALKTRDGNASGLAEHILNVGHHMHWDGAEVVDSHSDTFQCCIIEGWHIVCQRHSLNIYRDKSQLPQIYQQLVVWLVIYIFVKMSISWIIFLSLLLLCTFLYFIHLISSTNNNGDDDVDVRESLSHSNLLNVVVLIIVPYVWLV